MSQQEEDPQAIASLADRIHARLARVMSEEAERASKEGAERDTILQGSLNALLRLSAFMACDLISPEKDPSSEVVQARIYRVQVALSHALHGIMETERGKAAGTKDEPWPRHRKGHA